MKMKGKVFSILFALVLVLSLGLVTAVPAAAADVTPVCSLGSVADASAVWSTAQAHGGTYSALLTKEGSGSTGSTYVEFVPNTGVTLADLGAATATPEWSWWHLTSEVQTNHSQMELRFTQPGGDTDIVLDVTPMPLQNYLGTAEWVEQSLVQDTPGLLYYGTDAAGNGYSWTDSGGGGDALVTVSGIIAEIEGNTICTDEATVLEALVLTRVRIELWEAETARTSYIDDVTIDGTNYDLEGPTIELAPSSGSPGTTVTVTGSGFNAAEGARIYFDGVFKILATTSGTGAISGSNTFDIPDGKAAGTYDVDVVGVTSDRTASNTFTVPPLSITIDPTSGPPAESVAVTGSGFTVLGLVKIYFGTDTTPVKTVSADASGAISTTFPVPDKTAGLYTVKAIDGASLNEATETFTISTPIITLTPAGGPPTTTVTVAGGPFKLSATVTIKFDTDTWGTATANGTTGLITKDLDVPAVEAGEYDVTATDGVNTATETFTVGAAITLTPTSGAVGEAVTIEGAGFTPEATVTITGFGTALSFEADADEDGAIADTFDVPDKLAHAYTVTATDGTNTAEATFTVTGTPGLFDLNAVVQEIWDEVTNTTYGLSAIKDAIDALDFSGLETKIDAITSELDNTDYGLAAIKAELTNTTYGLEAIKNAIGTGGGGGVASLSDTEVPIVRNAAEVIIADSEQAFWGQLTVDSTATGYNIEVYDGDSWVAVESRGAKVESIALSGFGLQILNDARSTITVDYVFVYHSTS